MEQTIKRIAKELNSIRKEFGDQEFIDTIIGITYSLNFDDMEIPEYLKKYSRSKLNTLLAKLQNKKDGN